MGKEKVYAFEGRLATTHGRISHTIIVVPDHIIESLPVSGRVRTKGTVNGTPFALAIQHKKVGSRYFMVGGPLRREARLRSGDPVKVSFWLVDPEQVDIPEELAAVLSQDEEGAKVWKAFTPGEQRGLCHYVNSVKNVDTRIKRALEIVGKAKARQLHLQKQKQKKP